MKFDRYFPQAQYGYALVAGLLGGPGCAPVHGDYAGDRLTDAGVYEEASGTWAIMLSSQGGQVTAAVLGGLGQAPVPGDYDGDHKTDPGVYVQTNGNWTVQLSSVGYAEAYAVGFGGADYMPVQRDYDGDGKAGPAIYGVTSGVRSVKLSTIALSRTRASSMGWIRIWEGRWRPMDAVSRGSAETVPARINMENPYLALHREFRKAGADVLISSGQACVLFGIAAFSKDGDWIIRENERSCAAVLRVLGRHAAAYRLGAPLAPAWLRLGLTSHFEFQAPGGFRMRVDFCSRPPRVPNVKCMWKRALRMAGAEVVDVESLVQLKQTRRVRDYAMVGALAEVAGLEHNMPNLALKYLQDYELLSKAVRKWSVQAAACDRNAVRLLLARAPRSQVVAAIAIEQDAMIRQDQRRVDDLRRRLARYARDFAGLRRAWHSAGAVLSEQHRRLAAKARVLLRPTS